jgi:bacteriocin-like protein
MLRQITTAILEILVRTPVDFIELSDNKLAKVTGGVSANALTRFDCDFGDSGTNARR